MTADIDAISIVRNWLKENGYDGLFIDDCGCVLDDLQPCGKDFAWCKPGYIQRETGAENGDLCYGGDFIVGPEKPL